MTFFENLFNSLNSWLGALYVDLLANTVAYVTPVLYGCALVAVSVTAIRIALGFSSGVLRESLTKALLVAAVFGFSGSAAQYGDVIGEFLRDLPNELLSLTTGLAGTPGMSVGGQLDDFGDSMLTGIQNLWKSMSIRNALGVALVAVMFFIAWVFMSVLAVFTLALALIMSTTLAALGPLFILAVLFDTTREFFTKWLGYVLQFALLACFVGVLIGFAGLVASTYFIEFADDAESLNWSTYAGPMLMLGLMIKCFYELPALASSLSGGIGVGAGAAAARGFGGIASAGPAWAARRTVGEKVQARGVVRMRAKIRKANKAKAAKRAARAARRAA